MAAVAGAYGIEYANDLSADDAVKERAVNSSKGCMLNNRQLHVRPPPPLPPPAAVELGHSRWLPTRLPLQIMLLATPTDLLAPPKRGAGDGTESIFGDNSGHRSLSSFCFITNTTFSSPIVSHPQVSLSRAPNEQMRQPRQEGWHFSCERGCARDDSGKAGPFSAER